MRRVPTNAVYCCANVIALPLKFHITIARPETLDGMARGALGLDTSCRGSLSIAFS